MAIFWSFALIFACLVSTASTQSTSNTPSSNTVSNSASVSATPSPSISASLSLVTSSVNVSTTIRSGNQNIPTIVAVPTIFNVTVTPSPTASQSASASNSSASASASPTPQPIRLDTKVDGAFGTLGAILILTGLPSAFWGHKNRWTSFFLIGFYTLSLVCLVLILKFGVLPSINPPNATLRGLFVLACGVAGIAGGGVSIFFWKAAKYFIGAWGGLAFAWWLQCFRDGGLIGPIGFRWIMYTACAVIGFVLCTIPKLHYHIVLLATAMVGATSLMLGVDCYTTAGLKEFYIWNIGYMTMFPKFTQNGIKFPVSQTMQIELGLMGAIALMGVAVQFQVLKILQRKLKEIKQEEKRQEEASEALAARRFATLDLEKDEWDLAHPGLEKHGRNESALTSTTLGGLDGDSSSPLLGGPRLRYQSGLSDFIAAPTPNDELNRLASHALQSPGVLPPLDLGVDIESDVPKTYIADEAIRRGSRAADVSPVDSEAQKKRSQLLQEIETIRRSIDVLKSDTPAPSSSTDSRRQSMASGRTLSQNLSSFIPSPSHLRPPRQTDPHIRTHSMDLTRVGDATSISRPSSIPLDDDWDSYVRDRKLFQPPSGVSAPIQTLSLSLSASSKPGVSPAITEALAQRHRRESSLSFGGLTPAIAPAGALTPESSSTGNASPLPRSQPKKTDGQGGHRTPVAILPPRKPVGTPTPQKAETPRTKTYEELAERHREKMREMQAPLTKAEKAQAILQAAKARWEMSKEKEKASATKRLAEKAAAVTKDAKKKGKGVDNEEEPVRGRTAGREEGAGRHSRSLSAELLASLPRANSSSKRMSMMKVEDWQRHQVDEPKPKSVSPTTHQGSVSKRPSIVPFPDSGAHRDTMTRERRLPATARRDPPA